eukprot:1103303-Pleurochrysis_carterae.AAC.1
MLATRTIEHYRNAECKNLLKERHSPVQKITYMEETSSHWLSDKKSMCMCILKVGRRNSRESCLCVVNYGGTAIFLRRGQIGPTGRPSLNHARLHLACTF